MLVMNKPKAKDFIENSFLHDLITNSNITDISFNGKDFYYVDNDYGRKKYQCDVSINEVNDFIRQIANLSDKQFSYMVPYLDISIDKYRINAVHSSIGRIANDECLTFSIRIASQDLKINDKSNFLTPELRELFKVLIYSKCSILIGGTTGSGKTEFQKYLISMMEENTRVVVIDNVLELENIRNDLIDFTSWQVDDKNQNATASLLIKTALRSNPDWLIVAEARGSEMIDVLNSAMTGLPIISTIHS